MLGKFLVGTAVGLTILTGARAADLAPSIDACATATIAAPDASRCVGPDGIMRFRISATQSVGSGTIETFTSLTNQSPNALTADRLVASDTRRLGNAHRVVIAGMTARLLDDRVTVATQMGLSDYRDRSEGRTENRAGSAHMVRLDVKLADNRRLRWSVAGEMSDVSDDFFIGQASADGARLALPGRRLALSSTLNWQRARFTTSFDDYRGTLGGFASGRVGISRNGLALSLRTSRGQFDSGAGTSQFLTRTDNRSATFEFDLAAMAPVLAMDESFPAMLLPRNAMIGLRQGSSENRFAGVVERFERRGIELNATWETPIGETTLGYWRDTRVGATADLGQRDERMTQLAHMIRLGGWRFGIDASIAASRSTRGGGLDDRNIAFGGLVAYETRSGPRLMVQLSQDSGRMENDDLSFLTARRGQQVKASLDLTNYLRKRFDRDDLRLKLDYRKQLDRSTTEVGAFQQLIDRWTDGQSGEGVLVSFGMKL